MFETPHPPRTPETRLHFIKDQQRIVRPAPLGQGLYVFDRRKVGSHPLIGLQHHAGHLVGPQPGPL